jgi:hypothetical protein
MNYKLITQNVNQTRPGEMERTLQGWIRIDYQQQYSAVNRGLDDYKEDFEKHVSFRSRNRLCPSPSRKKKYVCL